MRFKYASKAKGGAIGAAVGAGLNVARQHRKNKKDPENKKSLRGAAAKGAVVGAGVGVAAGHAKNKSDARVAERARVKKKRGETDRPSGAQIWTFGKGNMRIHPGDTSDRLVPRTQRANPQVSRGDNERRNSRYFRYHQLPYSVHPSGRRNKGLWNT